jgi:hypothetical protein
MEGGYEGIRMVQDWYAEECQASLRKDTPADPSLPGAGCLCEPRIKISRVSIIGSEPKVKPESEDSDTGIIE